MTTRELTKYIETLRKLRNLEVDDFTKNIVSVRQYKRYLSGDSEMPYNVFYQLSHRLGFNPVKIQGDLEEAQVRQNDLIESIYNYTVSYQYDKVDEILKQNDFEVFLSEQLEMYFKTTMVIHNYHRYKKPKEECREELIKIVDYDTIIQKDLLEQVELLVLALLLMFLEGKQKEELLEILSNQLLKEKITLGYDLFSKLYVALRVAREYGIKGDNERVIDICLKALEETKRPHIHFNYDFFYYYLALSYRNLKDEENKVKYVKKLYNYLMFIDEENKTKKYVSKFKKEFNLTVDEI